MTPSAFIVFINVLATLFVGFGSEAAQINITPTKCISTIQKSVEISCMSDITDEPKHINLIQLSRNDEDPIVFLEGCSNITYGEGRSTSQFTVEGRITKDPRTSYLNVTLWNPTSLDTGIYTCLMTYVDAGGHPQQETVSSDLTVENLDVTSLEKALTMLKDSMANMEMKQENNKKDVAKKIEDLDNKTKRHEGLTDRVSFASAFSATQSEYSPYIEPKSGDILILPDVITRVGQGHYDNTTGIFTAPRDGIYVFHVTVSDGNHCGLQLELKKNAEVIAKLYSFQGSNWEHRSVSSFANLKTGDRVYSVIKTGGCAIRGDKYTMFTGYLIQAL